MFTKGTEDLQGEVQRLLAPYDEQNEHNDLNHDSPDYCGKWDWWMIGGRWTGMLVRDYDPRKDPANIELCDLCGGTGNRATFRDESPVDQHPSGCNGCLGLGWRIKWSTQYVPFNKDTLPVTDIECENILYAIVTPDGEWHEQSIEWPTEEQRDEVDREWRRRAVELVQAHRECIAVVVDCHV